MAAPEPAGGVHETSFSDRGEERNRSVQGEKEDSEFSTWVRRRAFSYWNYIIEGFCFYRDNPTALKDELLSGFTISLLQVPESVAFSYVAGVHPLQGLYGSFWMGLSTALLGGRPGMISGCAGALAVVIKDLMEDDGPFGEECADKRREYLFFTMVLTGILQWICGCCQCAMLVRLIPKTAFLGFFNGLAVVIFLSQLETFQRPVAATQVVSVSASCPVIDYGFAEEKEWYPFDEQTIWWMFLHVIIAMCVIEVLPLLPKIPVGKWLPDVGDVSPARILPPSLVAILLCMGLEWGILRPLLDVETPVVKDVSEIEGDFPSFHLPDVPWGEWNTWRKCFPMAASLCAVGLVESVLTLQAVDQILFEQTPVPLKNIECFAQGVGNLLSGFFMAMGGDAMIGQSTINVMNGAKGRLSAFTAAASLLFHIVVLSGFIEIVPTAALAGILFIVVIHTFSWVSISIIVRRALPLYMIVTIIIVTVLSVLTNLAIGIAIGIMWESLCFVWRESFLLEVTPNGGMAPADPLKLKSYRVKGTVFFANADEFTSHFSPDTDPPEVDLDLSNARILDYSAIYTLNVLGQAYETKKKVLNIRMKKDDFQLYMDASDEPMEDGSMPWRDSALRTTLPTKAAGAIQGFVTSHDLEKPIRYQTFLPMRGFVGQEPLTLHSSHELPHEFCEERTSVLKFNVDPLEQHDQLRSAATVLAAKSPNSEVPCKPVAQHDHPLGVPDERPLSTMSLMSEESV